MSRPVQPWPGHNEDVLYADFKPPKGARWYWFAMGAAAALAAMVWLA